MNERPIPPLTDRQKEVIDTLTRLTRENGYPPSIREMCAALNMKSTQSAYHHLDKLARRGYIRHASKVKWQTRAYLPLEWPTG